MTNSANFMLVQVDNYDDLVSSTEGNNRATLAAEIDRKIRAWALELKAGIAKIRESVYIITIAPEKLDSLRNTRFDILDQIKAIEVEADFPITLSIGVGTSGDDFSQNQRFAEQALDLAMGRGGDQAVVKERDKLSYYGGKSQTVGSNKRNRSRVVGHALIRLIDASSKVIIMGHKQPDMDSFGASLGIYRIVDSRKKSAYILINNYGESIDMIYAEAKNAYQFIKNEDLEGLVDDKTLVVVVDTNTLSIVENAELVKNAKRKAVIDHHRKSEDCITNTALLYVEPGMSSASEMVTEMMQHVVDKKQVKKFEALALMAGIAVDTNRFSARTGARTFEAAGWLKRVGADLSVVKRYFTMGVDMFKRRYEGIMGVEIDEWGVAYSKCSGAYRDSQLLIATVADELLSIRGVIASFVVGTDLNGKTLVSARSVGKVNVQLIMEEMGGGGHHNAAGTQLDCDHDTAIEKIKELLIIDREEERKAGLKNESNIIEGR